MFQKLVSVILTVVVATPSVQLSCPNGCECDSVDIYGTIWWNVRCTGVTAFPTFLPELTLSLHVNLVGNPTIDTGILTGKSGIKTLRLSGEIGTIQVGALQDLISSPNDDGSSIIISDANVTKIEGYAFKGVRNYGAIIIERCRIRTVQTLAFTELSGVGTINIREVNIFQIYPGMISGINGGLQKIIIQDTTVLNTHGSPLTKLWGLSEIVLENVEITGGDISGHVVSDVHDLLKLRLTNFLYPLEYWQGGLMNNVTGSVGSSVKIDNLRSSQLHVKTFQLVNGFELFEILNCNIQHVYQKTFSALSDLGILRLKDSVMDKIYYHAFHNMSSIEELIITNCTCSIVEHYGFNLLQNLNRIQITDFEVNHLDRHSFSSIYDVDTISFVNFRFTTGSESIVHDLQRIRLLEFVRLSTSSLVSKSFAKWDNIQTIRFASPAVQFVRYDAFCAYSDIGTLSFERPQFGLMESESFAMIDCVENFRLTNGNISTTESGVFSGLKGIGNFQITGTHIGVMSPNTFNNMKNVITIDVSTSRNSFPSGVSLEVTAINTWDTYDTENVPRTFQDLQQCPFTSSGDGGPPSSPPPSSPPPSSTPSSSPPPSSPPPPMAPVTPGMTPASVDPRQASTMPTVSVTGPHTPIVPTGSSSPPITGTTGASSTGGSPSQSGLGEVPVLYVILAAVGGALLVIITVVTALCVYRCRHSARSRGGEPTGAGSTLPPVPDDPPPIPPRGIHSEYLTVVLDSPTPHTNPYDYINEEGVDSRRQAKGVDNTGYQSLDGYSQPSHYYKGLPPSHTN